MAEEKVKLVRGIVARGHTVRVPSTTETVVVGVNPETGKPIRAPKTRDFGPNEEVTLEESEMLTLRANGFIIDPERVIPAPAEGSHLSEVSR